MFHIRKSQPDTLRARFSRSFAADSSRYSRRPMRAALTCPPRGANPLVSLCRICHARPAADPNQTSSCVSGAGQQNAVLPLGRRHTSSNPSKSAALRMRVNIRAILADLHSISGVAPDVLVERREWLPDGNRGRSQTRSLTGRIGDVGRTTSLVEKTHCVVFFGLHRGDIRRHACRWTGVGEKTEESRHKTGR